MKELWVYVCKALFHQEESASLFDWTVLERSITQLSRQPSAEGDGAYSGFGGPSWTEVTGCVRVCVGGGGAPGTPAWLLLTSLQDIGGNLGKHNAPAYLLWHSPGVSFTCSWFHTPFKHSLLPQGTAALGTILVPSRVRLLFWLARVASNPASFHILYVQAAG